MIPRLLLCTDLDRTLLPNGLQPESPAARPLFRRLAEQPAVHLAYVSGRDLGLVTDAIRNYELPLPDFAICDVGTSLYRHSAQGWRQDEAWAAQLSTDWCGLGREELQRLIGSQADLRLQEEEKQGRFKLSFYAATDLDPQPLLTELEAQCEAEGLRVRLVWSVDETRPIGLIDILPRRAGKQAAIEYLLGIEGVPVSQCLFAGDSGNDLEVLSSAIPAVLVANATEAVRSEALRRAQQAGTASRLYLARGGYRGLNGNYAAAILEGAVHYHPWLDDWLVATKG